MRNLDRWDVLTFLFIYLKLTGVIDWSWFWVTFPFWGMGIIFPAIYSTWKNVK